MELNELDTLINEQTADIVTPTDEEKIFNFLEKNEPEKKNVFEIETEDDNEEPETQEQQPEQEEESGEQIEYGLGKSFAIIHENILPPAAKALLEMLTSYTVDTKAMKLNAAQKKELAQAYEVIAQTLTSGESPIFAATVSILGIGAGQILVAIKSKETPKEPTAKKETPKEPTAKKEAAEKKIETRGRKKKDSQN